MTGLPPGARLRSIVTVIDNKTADGQILHNAFRGIAAEEEPFTSYFWTEGPVEAVDLLPEGAEILRSSFDPGMAKLLARCPGGTILISTRPDCSFVNVSSASPEKLGLLEADIRSRVPQPPPHDGTIRLRTWHLNTCGDAAVKSDRRIVAPSWAEVASNYPGSVRAQMQDLLEIERPRGSAKLILWHGEPGTGKTTALRALLRTWENWCAGQYVADPERLFGNPGYIAEVLTTPPAGGHAPTGHDPSAGVWRLIVAEDSDEYLRASARRDAGAGLGRLLNLADGVLGQGHNVLILLTTNEELNRLHPALVRPGRCMARVEFTRFSVEEARGWLPADVPAPSEPPTLAELFERRGDLERIGGGEYRRVSGTHV